MAMTQEIERLNANIKDYKSACEQKQEIINGVQEQVMDQQAIFGVEDYSLCAFIALNGPNR